METPCQECGGQHANGACYESGGKKAYKDLAQYFLKAANFMAMNFVRPGSADSSDKHFREKVSKYDGIAETLRMDMVQSGRNQKLRTDTLKEAMAALEEDFGIALQKGSEDNGGETFGFKKDDISALIDYLRKELGMNPTGMTNEEFEESRRKLADISISSQKNTKARTAAERSNAAKEAEVVYQKIGIESPPDREKAAERAIQTVLNEAGVMATLSVPYNLSSSGSSGYNDFGFRTTSDLNRSIYSNSIEDQLLTETERKERKNYDRIMNEHGIRELIDVRHDTDQINEYETEIIPGRKGIFGFGKTTDIKKRGALIKSEQIQRLQSEFVHNGKKEPSVRITYEIPQQPHRDWKEHSGREQILRVQIILAESDAKDVIQTIENDPAVIRKIVERVMKEKILSDPSAWETPQGQGDPLSPPYARWDAEPNGGKIYLQKEGMEPGFHEDRFLKVKLSSAS